VKKKPAKVEEAAAPYAARKPAKKAAPAASTDGKQVRYLDRETASKLTKEIMDKHHDLFRKLAQ